MSNKDYKLTDEDVNWLYALCRSKHEGIRETVHKACEMSNAQLAPWLEYSLVNDKSYDRVSIEYKWIPATIDDFYGYRRKTIAILKSLIFEI